MANPPSYTLSPAEPIASPWRDEHNAEVQAVLGSPSAHDSSSVSSTATTLPGYVNTPQYGSDDGSSSPELALDLSSSDGVLTPSTSRSGKSDSRKHKSSSGSWTASTSSRTRERLRLAELECEELRDKVDSERARIEQLKMEGRAVERCGSKAELRIRELKQDAFAAAAELPQRSTEGLFKKVCSTDLLFLIDTTGSMGGHIKAAKEQIVNIVDSIEEVFFNEAEVRIAVVGYKDHSDSPNIQFLDFTTDAETARSFVNELKATGGNDTPEDVLGGISRAINMSWKHQTRCIIHIADAPPHGRNSHNGALSDTYPKPGTEPHRLTYEPLIRQMIGLKINYALLRIDNITDTMAFNFFKLYLEASAECSLLRTNIHYTQSETLKSNHRSGPRGSRNSRQTAKSGLLFEESLLGTSYSDLQHLVLKNVTTSASRTAVRLSGSPARTKSSSDKKLNMNLLSIEEDGDNAKDVRLESALPQWERKSWFNEILMVEGFTPDVGVHGASTLNDMMASDDNIKLSITELTIRKRSRPFAQGAMRVAFYAKTTSSTNRFVVKSFKKSGKRLAHVAEDMQCQALCKAFALEFNALSGEANSIDFLVSTCLKGLSRRLRGDECLSLEPFIEGEYVKYNNNCGYVNTDKGRFNQMAQAFSHFTFERSQGKLLVSDIQGVGHFLTDPAVHTMDPERFKLTDTNLGKDGIKLFFTSHKCNDICTRLGLKSKASMVKSWNFEFRESWPSMDNTVCCSNKLCGKIVRVASAKHSDKFPGYHWCDTCWPQLQAYTVKKVCVARGPHHDFEVSEFFHESQGEKTPRKCPVHREETFALDLEGVKPPETALATSTAPAPITGPVPVMAALFGSAVGSNAEPLAEDLPSQRTSPSANNSLRTETSPFFAARSPFGRTSSHMPTSWAGMSPMMEEPPECRRQFTVGPESRNEMLLRMGPIPDAAVSSRKRRSSKASSASEGASMSRSTAESRSGTPSRTALMANNLWARLKSATKKSSLSRNS